MEDIRHYATNQDLVIMLVGNKDDLSSRYLLDNVVVRLALKKGCYLLRSMGWNLGNVLLKVEIMLIGCFKLWVRLF